MNSTHAAAAITDEQIKGLRNEAAVNADYAQVYVCHVALLAPVVDIQHAAFHARPLPAHLRNLTPASARAECVRVIADAQAMQD